MTPDARKDGGPAFPSTTNEDFVSGEDGMSLRDYFAAKLLPTIYRMMNKIWRDENEPPPFPGDDIARICYEMADAMLEEREKPSRRAKP